MLKENLKKETVVIGSNYSVFGKGRNKLQAVSQKDSALLAYGAQNIQKGYTDMVGLGRQSLADPLLPLKLREGREKEIKYCTTCDNCLELLIQQARLAAAPTTNTTPKSWSRPARKRASWRSSIPRLQRDADPGRDPGTGPIRACRLQVRRHVFHYLLTSGR